MGIIAGTHSSTSECNVYQKNRNKPEVDHLAPRETAYVLYLCNNRLYKQNTYTHTHAQSGAENSLFQFCLTITKNKQKIIT